MNADNRVLRGAVQLALGGLLTELIDTLVLDTPDRYDHYLVLLGAALVMLAQNYADAHNIPYPGRTKLLKRGGVSGDE